MKNDYLNYPKIVDDAMHIAVRNILKIVEKEGIKGEHHFFISFLTNVAGVQLSKKVKAQYPEEITIILQHQFEELTVEDKFFSLRLSFGGLSEVVVVPYQAITSFTDAGAKVAIHFGYYEDNTDEIVDINTPDEDTTERSNVIVLDRFRKNPKK